MKRKFASDGARTHALIRAADHQVSCVATVLLSGHSRSATGS